MRMSAVKMDLMAGSSDIVSAVSTARATVAARAPLNFAELMF